MVRTTVVRLAVCKTVVVVLFLLLLVFVASKEVCGNGATKRTDDAVATANFASK